MLKKKQIHVLTSRLCDGDISRQELDELGMLLSGDPQAIAEYRAHTDLHLQLGQELRPDSSWREIPSELTSGTAMSEGRATQANEGVLRKSRFITLRVQWMTLLAVAATLLVFVGSGLYWWSTNASFAARIVRKIHCDWDEERWGSPQSSLPVGREIKIEKGLMVLEFGNGAEVTLEAPVQFTISANDRGKLSFGKLTADVPKRGRGFTVDMPSVSVTDLGTQFGLSCEEHGISETHVFEGHVLVRADWDEQTDWKLSANEALRVDAATRSAKTISADHRSFASASHYVDPVFDGGYSAVQIPTQNRLVLWLDAARRLQLGPTGKVISWGDVQLHDNRLEQNAWQMNDDQRPRWVSRSAGDRPAVRFEGSSYLITEPFDTGDDITVLCVLQPSPRRPIGQILNFGGPRSLILDRLANELISGRVVSNLGGNSSMFGRIVGDIPLGNEPFVVIYCYGHSTDQAALYLDGVLVGQSQASSASAVHSSKWIGASNLGTENFGGDLSELLVFDSVLSPEQCEQLSNELMKKYGIVRKTSEPQILARPRTGDP